jgi:putative ABC transport system permease protein
MTGPMVLAARHVRHNPARSLIIAVCVAAACAIPMLVRVLVRDFQRSLVTRAQATPVVIGSKGNRFDLTLALLYFRRVETDAISFADFQQLSTNRGGTWIPVHVRFTTRGRPLVATSPDYFEHRRLRPAAGTLPLVLGDAVLGARLARELGLGVGDTLFSDQREVFDISKTQALKMHVVGVLAPSGEPDDEAVFTDTKTAWILEGLSHAHVDPNKAPEKVVMEKDPGRIVLSEALIDYNEVTPENVGAFHLHADDAHLPLSGIIFVPDSVKSGTLITSRLNSGKTLQAAVPLSVVDDLLAYVFRLRALIDGISLVLGLLTSLLVGLVTALSIRIRSRELETLRRIGVSRGTIAAMFSWEIVLLLGSGAILAVVGVAVITISAPDLIRWL